LAVAMAWCPPLSLYQSIGLSIGCMTVVRASTGSA
jgi:hypothetical protein